MAAAVGYSAPNAAAIRRALAQSVTKGKGLPATQFDAPFQQAISNLYGGLQGNLGNLDLRSARLASDYILNKQQQLQNQRTGLGSLADRMAFQGLAQSGIRTNATADLMLKYSQALAAMAQQNQRANEDITRQRQELYGNYQRGLGSLESGYVGNITKFLQDQATAQANAAQKAAQDAALRQVQQQQQQLAQNQTQAIQDMTRQLQGQLNPAPPVLNPNLPVGPPGTDWDAIARAWHTGPYAQTQPTQQTQPTPATQPPGPAPAGNLQQAPPTGPAGRGYIGPNGQPVYYQPKTPTAPPRI